jgi:TonB-linked SusC/RagA family outer membrane protein
MKINSLPEGTTLWKLRLKKIIGMAGIIVFLLMGCMSGLSAENAKTAPDSDNAALSLQQQTRRITGTVVDNNGEPVVGANVVQKENSRNGTVTDADGKFSLDVPPNATLKISFIGYLAREVAVGGQSSIDVTLTEDVGLLDEVVVIGYGTQKKASVTGAIATLQAEKVEDIPVANVSSALAGRMSGLYVSQETGAPGSAAAIRIRSINTWKSSGNDPLYVIDGIILDKRSFDMLDYSEIENISVLKDAASASVYGARAANGVILVTTRTGREGKFKMNYSYSYSFDQPSKIPEYGSAADMVRLNNYARSVAGVLPFYDEEEAAWISQNDPGKAWYDLAYSDPTLQKHTLNASGGSEKVRYFIGGNFFDQTAFIKNAEYKKFNIRSNVDVNFTNELSGSFKLAYNEGTRTRYAFQEDQSGLNINDNFGGLWGRLLYYLPDVPPLTSDGKYINPGWIGNPLAFIEEGGTNTRSDRNIDANFGLTYKLPFVKGLSVSANYSRNYSNATVKQYEVKPTIYNVVRKGTNGKIYTDEIISSQKSSFPNKERLAKTSETSNDYQLNLSVNYAGSFGKHNINAVLVYEQSEGAYEYFEAVRENFPLVQKDQFWATSSDRADSYVDGNESESGRASYIGRITYDYDEKYFLTAAARYDGSMQFAPDYRWGLFPSVQAGWVLSKEGFFNTEAINFLKLRTSLGLTGNDAVGGWAWSESYSNVGSYLFSALEPRVRYSGIVNRVLTWEKTRDWNIGFDSRFLGGYSLNLEYYNRHNYDILDSRIASLPRSFGGSMPPENYGIVDAHGVEIELGYRGSIKEVNYGIQGNFSYATNIVKLKDVAENVRDADNPNGRSTDYVKMLVATDIIRTQADLDALPEGYTIYGKKPALGVINFEDVSGLDGTPDGKIDDYDIQFIKGKHTVAPYALGLNLTADWKGLGIDVLFQGFLGVSKLYNDGYGRRFFDGMRPPAFWNDSWTPDNVNAAYPQAVTWDYTYDHLASTFWLKNSNYLRLQQVSLKYSLPKKLIKKVRLSDATFLLSGTNLFTLTKFDYHDPAGESMNTYPTMKTYTLGVNLSF